MTFVCPTCTYTSRHTDACDNPGCEANPSVTAEQKAAWAAVRAKRQAEEAERETLRRIRADPTGANAERDRAKEHFATLPESRQIEYSVQWKAAHDALTERVLTKTKRKAKVYEVHHVTEHGRRIFFAALLAGKCPEVCANEAIASYEPNVDRMRA